MLAATTAMGVDESIRDWKECGQLIVGAVLRTYGLQSVGTATVMLCSTVSVNDLYDSEIVSLCVWFLRIRLY